MHKCNCGKIGHLYVATVNRYYCEECFKDYEVPKGIKAEINIFNKRVK
ncbi:hypothetical protein M0R04_12545 [Candidatus Dojkabacteria bacterium]|jgi:hypothetical protein|nr:hypothetical protein [Candidatus Dojkabacteria bacterium]